MATEAFGTVDLQLGTTRGPHFHLRAPQARRRVLRSTKRERGFEVGIDALRHFVVDFEQTCRCRDVLSHH